MISMEKLVENRLADIRGDLADRECYSAERVLELETMKGLLESLLRQNNEQIKCAMPKVGAVVRMEETREFLLGFYRGATNGNH